MTARRGIQTALAAGAAVLALSTGPSGAQDAIPAGPEPHLNFYGQTGLIDMPSADVQPDGRISTTYSLFSGISRSALSFQIFPRVQGTFRYAGLHDINYASYTDFYDRSFDLSLLILQEGRYRPAVKIGLQDFAGTGVYSGEYIVTSKTLTPRLRATAGLGWGRLGSYGSIGSPFGDRPATDFGRGGKPNAKQWFRGPAAPFGGIEWQATDRLALLAEYSSDAYTLETGQGSASKILDRRSPVNLGFSYKLGKGLRLGGYYMYGSTVGLNFTYAADPYDPPVPGSTGPAPLPVRPRPARAEDPGAYATDWVGSQARTAYTVQLSELLEQSGLELDALALTGDRAQARIRNPRYDATAQAVGRTLRAMTQVLPASVETFRVVPVVDGMAASAVTLRRSDIEALEHAPDGSDRLLARAAISEAGPLPDEAVRTPRRFPAFSWGIGPYFRASYFDPDSPVRAQAGVRLDARFEPLPGLVFAGQIQKKGFGNLDENRRVNSSRLQPVRSNFGLYDREGDPALTRLYGAYYFRPGRDLYGRVTAGYLERMFGGVSAEVLWKPVSSRLALGAEMNYVTQRDYDMKFGFQDYSVATGHVSAYYDFGGGYLGQVDLGRYLAGDTGATIALDREFRNGWKVGAFATFTNVSADEFGEGSFDKGVRMEIPLSWFTGQPSRQKYATTLRPLTRDGGARLDVPGRLYETVRDYDKSGLEGQWGRVWR